MAETGGDSTNETTENLDEKETEAEARYTTYTDRADTIYKFYTDAAKEVDPDKYIDRLLSNLATSKEFASKELSLAMEQRGLDPESGIYAKGLANMASTFGVQRGMAIMQGEDQARQQQANYMEKAATMPQNYEVLAYNYMAGKKKWAQQLQLADINNRAREQQANAQIGGMLGAGIGYYFGGPAGGMIGSSIGAKIFSGGIF